MSTLRNDQPGESEVRSGEGELRKPQDRHDQPEQGGSITPPDDGHERDRLRDPTRDPRVEAPR